MRGSLTKLVFIAVLALATTTSGDEQVAPGERIYRNGILPSGQPVRATLQSDVPARGAQLICTGCHGRSGLGRGEGRSFTPPVTGTWLYQPREIRRKELYASRTLRPAYTDATLAKAIRSGIDPNGRALDAMMPRYALGDGDLGLLISYLKSLSSTFSPGVTDTHVHFATVITDGVDPKKRKAMLDVLETFFQSKNAETRQETDRARHSPIQKEWKHQAYRKWELHVWELKGTNETWRAQLEAHYERQPVFATIGGIGAGSWQPVHEFCEQHKVPCILPDTDLPVISETDFYSVYFSKGMTLEAEVLARHLHAETAAPIVQVYRNNDARGVTAATTLQRALEARGITSLRDRVIEGNGDIPATFWPSLLEENPSAWLVLWLGDRDLPPLAGLAGHDAGPQRFYLSTSLAGQLPQTLPDDLQGKIHAIQRFGPPEDSVRRRRVIDAWLRSKGIAATDEPLQANTLFTANLVSQALKHIGSNFYREYFLERIEHIFDSMVTPSAYPRVTLGPNQRYASKGGYVLKLAQEPDGKLAPVGEWIVP
jgi:ABC-type branched-subunit amino acid transport system substrate-binding protein